MSATVVVVSHLPQEYNVTLPHKVVGTSWGQPSPVPMLVSQGGHNTQGKVQPKVWLGPQGWVGMAKAGLGHGYNNGVTQGMPGLGLGLARHTHIQGKAGLTTQRSPKPCLGNANTNFLSKIKTSNCPPQCPSGLGEVFGHWGKAGSSSISSCSRS